MATDKIYLKKLDVNKYQYSKETAARAIQLTAFFHILKNKYADSCYAALASSQAEIFIPTSFNIYETIALAKYYRPLNWYIELDKDHYAEIRAEEVTIKGDKKFIQEVSDAFRKGETYSSDYPVYFNNFEKTGNSFAWNNFTKNLYARLVAMGDKFIRNGSFVVYPSEEYEFFVFQESDYKKADLKNLDYIILRSNIEREKTILLDIKHYLLLATGLNELEEEEMIDFLK